MRLLLRFVGLLLLAAAFAALIVDGTRSVAAGRLDILPMGASLQALSPAGFAGLKTLVEHRLPALWDPVLVTLFGYPTWLVLGLLGLVLFAVTRRPPPKIGYGRR